VCSSDLTVRLTERDLTRIVRRVIKEQDESDSDIYTVKPGDNLTKIAKMYNMTVSDILKVNSQIKDANKIYPGDEINMPSRIVMGSTVPRCDSLLVYRESTDIERITGRPIGGSEYMDLEITGNVELNYNATVSPNSRAVTVIKNGKPFCKIPVYNTIGDCRDEMELTSDEPGASMSASLVSPVSVNLTGSVSPKNQGLIIRDGGGYFCTVPTTVDIDMLKDYMPESRRRRGYRY
jgi:LysM repeat protein